MMRCDSDDERKTLFVRVRVHNEPFMDVGIILDPGSPLPDKDDSLGAFDDLGEANHQPPPPPDNHPHLQRRILHSTESTARTARSRPCLSQSTRPPMTATPTPPAGNAQRAASPYTTSSTNTGRS